MQKTLLIALCTLALAGCESVSIKTAGLRQPDIDRPGGWPPVATSEIRMIDRVVGADVPSDPVGCVRLGAVYTSWGEGDWMDFTPGFRPTRDVLLEQLRQRAAEMGANALAGADPGHPDTTFMLAYRCAT